jgi:hypothetical protein
MKKVLIASTVVILGLAGCGQIYNREPVGIGFHTDELTLSPCACIRVWRG